MRSVHLPALLLALAGFAAAQKPAAPAPAPNPQRQLQDLLALTEPGAQRRGLEAYLTRYPQSADKAQIYTTLIDDATQLGDDRGVLTYNEQLEALDPDDLAQRIKTINLLLASSAPADRLKAQKDAATFAQQVEAKAQEPAPPELGAARYRIDMARMRALAALFQGTAAQALGDYPAAQQHLAASLKQAETEEAAEHLGQVYQAQGKAAEAVASYALALALPGQTIAERDALRLEAGTLYAQLHQGSQAGFGDLILKKFDAVAARDAAEQAALAPSDAGSAAATGGANARAASAGDFALESLDGTVHRLRDLRGRVVVADSWATWSGPCRVQHPLLESVRAKFATNHNVIFIAVNEDADKSRVAPFLKAQGWATTTWLDAGLAPFLNVEGLPTTLIFSPAGAVVYRQEGFVPATFATELTQALSGELARAFPAHAPAAATP
jgi:thiol-disulfide isomerase/thioredoxin